MVPRRRCQSPSSIGAVPCPIVVPSGKWVVSELTRYRRTRLTLREDRATITHSLHLVLLPLWAFRSTLLSYARAIVQWLPLHNGSQHLHLWIILHCACCLATFVILTLAFGKGRNASVDMSRPTKRAHPPSTQGTFLHQWRLAKARLMRVRRRWNSRKKSWQQSMHTSVRSRTVRPIRYIQAALCRLAYSGSRRSVK